MLCHHAAQIDVRRSMTDPRFDADVNVGGLLNLMQAAVRGRLGEAGALRLQRRRHLRRHRRSSPPRRATRSGRSRHYGASKAASELYLGVYQANYGLAYAALRYANVYGPRQDPHGEAGVVAIFCGRLLDGKPCTIYGDGMQTRDYVYVGDVARANLLAAERSFSGALNIGTGVETDVTQLHAGLSRAAGSAAPPIHAEARLGEQRRSCIDPTAAGRALGWRPEVGDRAGAGADLPVLQGEARPVGGLGARRPGGLVPGWPGRIDGVSGARPRGGGRGTCRGGGRVSWRARPAVPGGGSTAPG